MPGSEARMRVSSLSLPSWIGTLKSTRMKTRLSRKSTSDIFRTAIADEVPGSRAYFAPISSTATSSIRLLNPHSLSYQENTFTSVPPDTLVSVESNTDDAGLWLKSLETRGSLQYSRIPFRSVSEACFAAPLISSTVVARLADLKGILEYCKEP